MTERPQPHDPDAERALLGAILVSPAAATDVDALLVAADLYHPHHDAIYLAVMARLSRSRPVNAVFIAEDLARSGVLGKLFGGAAYLHTCIDACPDPSHAVHYAHIIARHAQARRLLNLATDLQAAALIDDPARRAELIATAQTSLGRTAVAGQAVNGHNIRLTPASAFRIKAVRWVWEGRMPLGEITLVPGREGVGKSTFLAWLAAAITLGNLPGIYHGQPRAVLYAASEDAWSYTIAPRMLAAGADLNLVYRVDVEADDGSAAGLILPRDCRHLPQVAAKVDAAALMCDPILSLVDTNINSFKSGELRTALEPLRRMAEEAQLAVPALVHFNKSPNADIGTMIAGSRAWVEVARAVIAIAQDRNADDYTCVVSQTKNNLGRLDLPNLAYTIDSVTLETEDGEEAAVGRLRWTGETDITAEDLLSSLHRGEQLGENALAIIDFIQEQGTPVTVQQVADHFKDRIKYDTVKKTLARCARRGEVVSPSRGLYAAPGKGRLGRKHAPARPPLYPPVPTSPMSLTQVSDGIGVSPVGTVGTQEGKGTPGTLGTGDRGTRAPARTRARQPDELVSCKVCFGPLEDIDETGCHPGCRPPEEEPEREWYP